MGEIIRAIGNFFVNCWNAFCDLQDTYQVLICCGLVVVVGVVVTCLFLCKPKDDNGYVESTSNKANCVKEETAENTDEAVSVVVESNDKELPVESTITEVTEQPKEQTETVGADNTKNADKISNQIKKNLIRRIDTFDKSISGIEFEYVTASDINIERLNSILEQIKEKIAQSNSVRKAVSNIKKLVESAKFTSVDLSRLLTELKYAINSGKVKVIEIEQKA